MSRHAIPYRAYLLAVLAFALLAGCSAEPKGGGTAAPASGAPQRPQRPPVPVEVFPVEARTLRDAITIVGSLAPNESVDLRFELSGRISEIIFEEGQQVEAGQVLVRLDDSELKAQLAAAKASFALALSNLQRVRQLVESRSRTESDLDRATSEHDRAAAEVRLLEVRLARTELRAPFSGTLGAREVSPGDFVSPNTPVTRIEDLSQMKVDFEVPERALPRLKVGAAFSLAVAGESLEGEVFFVSPVIDRSTRASNVKGIVRQPGERIKPGMFVTVALTLEARENALVVPESAILARSGGLAVVVVREKEGESVADFLPVRLGLRERGIVEIIPVRGPLAIGEQVVASGVGAVVLLPGDRVMPRPLKAELRPEPPSS